MWSLKNQSQETCLSNGKKKNKTRKGLFYCVILSWPGKALSWSRATITLWKVYLSLDVNMLVFSCWGLGYREFSSLGWARDLLERALPKAGSLDVVSSPALRCHWPWPASLASLHRSCYNCYCFLESFLIFFKTNYRKKCFFVLSQDFNYTNSFWQYFSAKILTQF